MEIVIGKMGPAVAVEAIGSFSAQARFGLGEEEFEPALLDFTEGGFSLLGAIEFRIEGELGEEEVFEGEADGFRRNFSGSEGFGEEGWVGGVVLELGDHVFEGFVHFEVVFDGHERLGAERGGASVPEEG